MELNTLSWAGRAMGQFPAPQPVLKRPGRATRHDTYVETCRLADTFQGLRREDKITTAAVAGMIRRGFFGIIDDDGEMTVLIDLVESIWDAARWISADLTVHISMDRLRKRTGGIDLRPLAARLAELIDAEQALEAQLARERMEKRMEVDDLEEVEVAMEVMHESEKKKESTMVDTDGRYSFLQSPSQKESVSKVAPQERVGAGSEKGKRAVDPASEREIMNLMIANSVLLAKSMNPVDYENPSPVTVGRAVIGLLRSHGVFREIKPALWNAAVERHGLAAGPSNSVRNAGGT